eukprot:Rmarinus@m.28277
MSKKQQKGRTRNTKTPVKTKSHCCHAPKHCGKNIKLVLKGIDRKRCPHCREFCTKDSHQVSVCIHCGGALIKCPEEGDESGKTVESRHLSSHEGHYVFYQVNVARFYCEECESDVSDVQSLSQQLLNFMKKKNQDNSLSDSARRYYSSCTTGNSKY